MEHFKLTQIEKSLIRNKHNVITFADVAGDCQLDFAEYEKDKKRCHRTTTKSVNKSISQSINQLINQSTNHYQIML